MEHDHMLRPSHNGQSSVPTGESQSTATPAPAMTSIPPPPEYTQQGNSAGQHAPISLTLRPLNDVSPELAPIQPQHERNASGASHTLPPLSSVTSALRPSPEPAPPAWPNTNPYAAYYTPGLMPPPDTPPRAEQDTSAASPARSYERRSTSVSLDDPDVRMAAEALGNLRAGSVSSPSHRNREPQAEPILSLFTTSYPRLATTIGGATSVASSIYDQGKNISPHIIRTSAEYLEDKLSPLTERVGTSLEGPVRWLLQGKKHQSGTDLEPRSSKRRRAGLNDDKQVRDQLSPGVQRRISTSTDSPPAYYDDQRSPPYSEVHNSRPGSRSEWTRLIVSTSALGVAMLPENLRRLKSCLEIPRDANSFIGNNLEALKNVVDQYDAGVGAGASSSELDKLIDMMNGLKRDIVSRLQAVITSVSQSAGSAVPLNVRDVIRDQFTGLPIRFQAHLAQESPLEPGVNGNQESGMRQTARSVVVLAKDGLQMISNVSDVIDRTIQSAQLWLDKKAGASSEAEQSSGFTGHAAQPAAQWASAQPSTNPSLSGEDVTMST
ncbi:clock-controlled protein 8 [Echria macrotheca]|uniref:Clock-controlled protein 8 n=1 Tax=Echria macrotheca TaxID=438768 RepID=A0AAJ0B2K6_9PEZI|nr:clock-controlled protein 8 [Echria macrotheca]